MTIPDDFKFEAGQVFRFAEDSLSLLVEHRDSDTKYFRMVNLNTWSKFFLGPPENPEKDPWFHEHMTYVGKFHDVYTSLRLLQPDVKVKAVKSSQIIAELLSSSFYREGQSKEDLLEFIEKIDDASSIFTGALDEEVEIK